MRPLLMMLCLWLVVVMSAAPAMAAGVPCDDWNTQAFFETATPESVTACLRAGADPKARSKYGYTPLHWAAVWDGNPTMIETLLAV